MVLTPYRVMCMTRPNTKTPMRQMPVPIDASLMPSLNHANYFFAQRPSAMRKPISCLRCRTENAITP